MTDITVWEPAVPPMTWADLVEEYGKKTDYPGLTGDIGEEMVCRLMGSYGGPIWTPAYVRDLYADTWEVNALSAELLSTMLIDLTTLGGWFDEDDSPVNFDMFQPTDLLPSPTWFTICGDWLYEGLWQWLIIERADSAHFWVREPYGSDLIMLSWPPDLTWPQREVTQGYKGRVFWAQDGVTDWRQIEAADTRDEDSPDNVGILDFPPAL